MTAVFVKRPVAFRVPRSDPARAGEVLSATEWQLFASEDEAAAASDAKGCDYQGLYVRDGTVITLDRDQVAAEVIEQCAKLLDVMADEQDATNNKYPDHAKAYASWVDRVYHFRRSAEAIRALALTPPNHLRPGPTEGEGSNPSSDRKDRNSAGRDGSTPSLVATPSQGSPPSGGKAKS